MKSLADHGSAETTSDAIAQAEYLSRDEADYVSRMLYVERHAVDLFESNAFAAKWMRLANEALAGLKPIEVPDSQGALDRVRGL